ncbi:hypothetical protein WR25_18724 [Diploscapter pachys]|uniref:Uncharacterized protein n=1 Tax=Diploscapter pachys TaxID=2018661 RepID=A0A2A2KFX2_9BILA|nr:hypothetical protein WR25_18724 [Diploscapter pachys]
MKINISGIGIKFIVHSLECVVSEWTAWSKCYGGCKIGQMVRNRDVAEPPLPEFALDGIGPTIVRHCPHLYETKRCPKCDRKKSEREKPQRKVEKVNEITEEDLERQLKVMNKLQHGSIDRTSEKQHAAYDAKNESDIEDFGDWKIEIPTIKIMSTAESTTERMPIRAEESTTTQAESSSESLNNLISEPEAQRPDPTTEYYTTTTTKLPSITTTTTQFVTEEQAFKIGRDPEVVTNRASIQEVTEEKRKQQEELNKLESFFVNSLVIELPRRKQPNNAIKAKNSEEEGPKGDITGVLKDIEKAASGEALKEKTTRKVKKLKKKSKKNKSKSKEWEDWHRISTKKKLALKRITVTSSTTPKRTTVTSTTTQPKTETRSRPMESSSSSSSREEVWQKKKNYVPNTRKHASDITAQLYMTHKIVQAMKMEPIAPQILPLCKFLVS